MHANAQQRPRRGRIHKAPGKFAVAPSRADDKTVPKVVGARAGQAITGTTLFTTSDCVGDSVVQSVAPVGANLTRARSSSDFVLRAPCQMASAIWDGLMHSSV
jgi:hypothetical protein